MGWASTDLRPLKKRCCELIDEMQQTHDTVIDLKCMRQLDALTHTFPVDQYKLITLLKSLLMTGNKSRAKKLITTTIPDVKYAWWVQVGLWPFVVIARIIGAVINLLRPVGRLGKL